MKKRREFLRFRIPLFLAEPDGFFNGDGEFLGEVLVILVVGEVEAVEAIAVVSNILLQDIEPSQGKGGGGGGGGGGG